MAAKGKKGKEGSKGTATTGGQKWDEALMLEQLETENWRVCIAVMTGDDYSSEEMMSSLARHISSPVGDSKQRRRFYSLSQQEVLKKALEGGGAGAVSKSQASKGKGKGVPSPGGVLGGRPPGAEMLAELVKSQSVSEEGPTPDTVARAIKTSLLVLRQEDMLRRQQEGGSRPRSGAGSPSKKGDKKGEKATPPAKGKGGGKGGKGAEEGIPMPAKPESTMKKRGEDAGEVVFLDDEPVHGPEAYVLLSGVRVAEVLAEMGRVGVPPSCVVRVRAGPAAQGGEELEEGEKERRNKIGDKLSEFWRGAEVVLETSRDSGTRDTGVIQFEFVTEEREGEGVEGLYDTLAGHIYTLVEQKRQHRQYLDCLSLADLSGGRAKRDKSDGVYRELLAPLPSQCNSVPLLVESMLQQVCVNEATLSIPVDRPVAMGPALQESLKRIKKRASIGEMQGKESSEEKTASYPVIYEGDKIRERESLLDHPAISQHSGLDKRGVEKRMLDCFWATQLVRRFPTLDQEERCRVDARYQQLLRIARQSERLLSPNEIQSYLLKLAFAEMLDSQNSRLFDDPYPSQDRQESIARLKSTLSRLEWSEVLSRDVITQRIQVLATNATCLVHYHKQSDKLLLLFHSHTGREEWSSRMLTPAGFYLYQRFLHSDISPLVDQLSHVNTYEREKLPLQQEMTPNASQVSLTQLSAGKEGRTSSLNKSINRASRTSKLKDSSRTSTPVSVLAPVPVQEGSREDLLSAQRSEVEQRCLFLTGYDVREDWYAGKGESDKIQLSADEFIRCEQRCFHTTPLTSVSVQYCHNSGLSAGLSLLMERSPPLHKLAPTETRDNTGSQDDDTVTPATILDPGAGIMYGSYRVSMRSGVKFSLSPFGKLGGLHPPREMMEDAEMRQLEEELERSTPHSLPPATSESKVGGKAGGRGKKGEEQQAQEQQRQLAEERERRRREIDRLREDILLAYRRANKYQSLFLSTEHGLQITCATKVDLSNNVTVRDGSDGCLRITQCHPNSPSPTQSCDQLRLAPASLEVSRSYLEDGTVIKLMRDATVQLLWPDGSCARSLQEGELDLLSRNMVDLTDLTSDSNRRSLLILSTILSSSSPDFSSADRQWMYTDRVGQKFVYKWVQEAEEVGEATEEQDKGDGEQVATPDKEPPVSTFTAQVYGEPLLRSSQTDPVSGEQMVTREDQVTAVLRGDGTLIVQFSDGTRITSSDSLPDIQIECPGYAKVRFSTPAPGQATITLFDSNEVVSNRNGEHSVTCDDVTCRFTSDGLLSVRPLELTQLDLDLVSGAEWMRVSNSNQVYAIDKHFNASSTKQDAGEREVRMFVLTRDGSGMEMLDKERAESELERWRSTKGLLVQSHALPGTSDTIIHSAIRPVTIPSREISHLPYTEDNIVPIHLRTQCYFPIKRDKYKSEDKRVFGSGVGRGLSIGVSEGCKGSVKVLPHAFWRRELLEDRPVSEETLSRLVTSLKGVNMWWEEARGEREQLAPVEIRTESVREEACSLFQHLRSIQLEDRVENEERLVEEYKERVLTPPQEKRHAPPERRPERVEQEKREREEFNANMTALRNRDIPGYFESESGVKFLQQAATAPPDMIHLTEQLPVAMRIGEPRDMTPASSQPPVSDKRLILPRLSELSQDAEQLAQGYASTTILLPDNSGSTVSLGAKERPVNPSPRFPTSAEPSPAGSEVTPDYAPAHEVTDLDSGQRPQNPVTTELSNPIPEYLFYNVAGVPRTAPVKLPTSIKTLRPGDRESERIDATKKQPNTSSLSMPLSKSLQQGISLQQTELDFGLLKEGSTYSANVHIKNIGITSTRYKIKPPPPSTGLKVSYTPHPIAAGMGASFQVDIYAVPVGVVGERGQGKVRHDLEIISGVNTLSLPITATVLTAISYEEDVGEVVLTRGVTILPGTAGSMDRIRDVKK